MSLTSPSLTLVSRVRGDQEREAKSCMQPSLFSLHAGEERESDRERKGFLHGKKPYQYHTLWKPLDE